MPDKPNRESPHVVDSRDWDSNRANGLFSRLAGFGKHQKGGLFVPGFSTTELLVFNEIAAIFREIDPEGDRIKIKHDPLGNMFVVIHGSSPRKAAIVSGTHVDTVPLGGKYDGRLQVVYCIELARRIVERDITLTRNLVFVLFRCEEGSETNMGSNGSKIVCGIAEATSVLERRIAHKLDEGRYGMTVGELIAQETVEIATGAYLPNPKGPEGGSWKYRDLSGVGQARIESINSLWHRYLEVHIEQGNALLGTQYPLVISSAIASPDRYQIVLTRSGGSGHAGAAPMITSDGDIRTVARADSALLSAELHVAFMHLVYDRLLAPDSSTPNVSANIVETSCLPGSVTQIQSDIVLDFEIRGTDQGEKTQLFELLRDRLQVVAREFNKRLTPGLEVKMQINPGSSGRPVTCDKTTTQQWKETAKWLGYKYRVSPCMAWHDAGNAALAGIPTGIALVRAADSHTGAETMTMEDAGLGFMLYMGMVLETDATA